jgi:nitrogen fixation/metabolism regulation signal transduction histidine kinase
VVLLTLLAAIYGAVYSAQRLTRPVQDLIAGTRAVGKGELRHAPAAALAR